MKKRTGKLVFILLALLASSATGFRTYSQERHRPHSSEVLTVILHTSFKSNKEMQVEVMTVMSDIGVNCAQEKEGLPEAQPKEAHLLLSTEKRRALSTVKKRHPSISIITIGKERNVVLVLAAVLIIVVVMYHWLLKPIVNRCLHPKPNNSTIPNLETLNESNSNFPQQLHIPMARAITLPNEDMPAEVVQDGVNNDLLASILIQADRVEVIQDYSNIPTAEPVDAEDISGGIFGAVHAEILQDISPTTNS